MAKCKECLHFETCSGYMPSDMDEDVWDYFRKGIPEEIPNIEDRCNFFLDKARFVEVAHGHMVERIVDHECPWYIVYDCSECGYSVERWHNYCPNCGAKMDGDGDGT